MLRRGSGEGTGWVLVWGATQGFEGLRGTRQRQPCPDKATRARAD